MVDCPNLKLLQRNTKCTATVVLSYDSRRSYFYICVDFFLNHSCKIIVKNIQDLDELCKIFAARFHDRDRFQMQLNIGVSSRYKLDTCM